MMSLSRRKKQGYPQDDSPKSKRRVRNVPSILNIMSAFGEDGDGGGSDKVGLIENVWLAKSDLCECRRGELYATISSGKRVPLLRIC
jgi:hypothetical protein